MTPDELITSLIDCIVYPLDEALRAQEEGGALPGDPSAVLGHAFVIANAYRIASDLWGACLWDDRIVDRREAKRVLIRSIDEAAARNAAVSEHRHETHLWQLTYGICRTWRDLSVKAKKMLTPVKGVTRFDAKRSNPFFVEKMNLHWRQNIPHEACSWLVACEEYLQPFVHLQLPKFPGITLEMLYRAWCVMGTVVRAALSQVPNTHPPDAKWLLSHAVRITRLQLTEVLQRALDIDDAVARALIFAFSRTSPAQTGSGKNR